MLFPLLLTCSSLSWHPSGRRLHQEPRLSSADRVDRRLIDAAQGHADAQLWKDEPDKVHAPRRPGHEQPAPAQDWGIGRSWRRRKHGVLPVRRQPHEERCVAQRANPSCTSRVQRLIPFAHPLLRLPRDQRPAWSQRSQHWNGRQLVPRRTVPVEQPVLNLSLPRPRPQRTPRSTASEGRLGRARRRPPTSSGRRRRSIVPPDPTRRARRRATDEEAQQESQSGQVAQA